MFSKLMMGGGPDGGLGADGGASALFGGLGGGL